MNVFTEFEATQVNGYKFFLCKPFRLCSEDTSWASGLFRTHDTQDVTELATSVLERQDQGLPRIKLVPTSDMGFLVRLKSYGICGTHVGCLTYTSTSSEDVRWYAVCTSTVLRNLDFSAVGLTQTVIHQVVWFAVQVVDGNKSPLSWGTCIGIVVFTPRFFRTY